MAERLQLLRKVAVPAGIVLAALVGFGFPFLFYASRFQTRSKRFECTANLKSLWVAETAFYKEHQRYTTHLNEIGFMPERGNRYAYLVSRSGPTLRRATQLPEPGSEEIYRGVEVDTRLFPSRGVRVEDVPQNIRNEPLGLIGHCPDCSFLAVCGAQLDDDPALDVWSISSRARTDKYGQPIAVGQPFQEVDDAAERQMPVFPPSFAVNDD